MGIINKIIYEEIKQVVPDHTDPPEESCSGTLFFSTCIPCLSDLALALKGMNEDISSSITAITGPLV